MGDGFGRRGIHEPRRGSPVRVGFLVSSYAKLATNHLMRLDGPGNTQTERDISPQMPMIIRLNRKSL